MQSTYCIRNLHDVCVICNGIYSTMALCVRHVTEIIDGQLVREFFSQHHGKLTFENFLHKVEYIYT